MQQEAKVLIEMRGALGLVTLNRPGALNALDTAMVAALEYALDTFAAAPAVKAVAICGAGERAFCAGGDIRMVRQAVMEGSDAGARFLAAEYHLNARIGAYPKPFVALMHGFVLGGGAGISVHGGLRIADPGLSLGMPETGIGFIPDVGASHFLSRCPGLLGHYMGLTGVPIGAGDALAAGLVDHIVMRADFPALLDRLSEGQMPASAARALALTAPAPILAAHRACIDACFCAPDVETILERLDGDKSDFARATAATLRTRSPTSLKLVLRQLDGARTLSLRECLAQEYRLAMRVIQSHDFREGVRAALVDKDRNPRWRPATLQDVPQAVIDAAFAPLTHELFND
jgi:enoyl-CoA hydratase